MFSVSTSVVLLVFFVSQAPGQSAATVGPSVNSSVCSSVNSSVSLSVNSSLCPSVKLTSAILSTPSSTASTVPPSIKTCAKLGVVIDKSWSEDYGNSSSEKFRNVSRVFSSALNKLYNDSAKYDDVKVSETFANKEGKLFAEAELRLVFKGGDAVFIEDVFKEEVATGKLDPDLPVVEGSSEFKPLGVSWKDWKAKEGECEDKCEGAAGPFLIVRECQDGTCSCKGLKKSKKTDECTKYCPSGGSSTAVTVSSVILVIGIFLSSSFQ